MVAAGAHPKYLQAQMGHSSIRVTLDLYAHLFPDANRGVLDNLDALTTPSTPHRANTPKLGGMERAEAEAILDGDRETAIALLMRVGELVEANRRLEARVAELERRLNRSSRNSSLPPSQDPPSAPKRPGWKESGRTRGGQPGHEGRYRRLRPSDRVDEVVEHWPARCRSCARVFDARELVDAVEPWRHQVAELPPIAVRVTEHRLHAVCCPEFASQTRADLPTDVPRSAFGPRLQAAVVTLAVRNRVSRRDTTELARELFGVELATGSVDAIIQRAGEALAGPYTELEQRIKQAAVVNIESAACQAAVCASLTARRVSGSPSACRRLTLLGTEKQAACSCRLLPDTHEPSLRCAHSAHKRSDDGCRSKAVGSTETA